MLIQSSRVLVWNIVYIVVFTVVGVPAIFSTHAATLAYVFQTLTEENRQNAYDPLALPIPWNSQVHEFLL